MKKRQSGLILPVLILLILLTIVMIAVAGYLYLNNPDIEKPQFMEKIKEDVNQKVNISDQFLAPARSNLAQAEIAITKDGFVPETISIAVGQQVTFVNKDNNTHRILPYPLATREMLPELDSEDLQPSDSFTYSFENKGTFTLSENIKPGKYKVTVVVN